MKATVIIQVGTGSWPIEPVVSAGHRRPGAETADSRTLGASARPIQ